MSIMFSNHKLRSMVKPMVYIFRSGPVIVYVGASAYGIGRPLSSYHKMCRLLQEGMNLSLEVIPCKNANEAFDMEMALIQEHRPEYNSVCRVRGSKWDKRPPEGWEQS